MTRGRTWLLGALGGIPLVLAPMRGAAGPPEAAAISEPVTAALGDMRADPAAWLGREVRFVLQLERELDTWQPYLTRFGPGDFAAFGAWPDEAFLWERDAFQNPTPRVFARRDTPAARLLHGGGVYDRFEVRGVVREIFLSEPWIEVLEARRLSEHVGEGTILHAARGLELFAQDSRELARDQLQRARAGLLPAHAVAELDRLIATCDG